MWTSVSPCTQAAEAGLPVAMFNLALCLDKGEGAAPPDYPAGPPRLRST
jgi:TPR repeat protein